MHTPPPPEDSTIKVCGHKFRLLHVPTRGLSAGDEYRYGAEGIGDLAAEIAVLKKKGYDKTMSLELFNSDLWTQDPLEVITEGLSCMKALWQN